MGRPAAVLPAGSASSAAGGGGIGIHWDDEDTGEDYDTGLGYFYAEHARGLAPDVEVVAAMKNLFCWTGVLRYQLVGQPLGACTRLGLDVAVECGAGVWLADAIVADAHLGASCSLGGLDTTPYAGFRYHLARVAYTTNRDWHQCMAFVGLYRQRAQTRPYALEFFHGWAAAVDPDDPKRPTTWGLNVVIGRR
jgi:hypothetical protein